MSALGIKKYMWANVMISLPEISTLLHLLLLRGANNTSPPISDPSHYGHRARMELQHRDHRHQWCHHAACPHETRFESLTWTHHTVFHQVRRGVREVPTDRRAPSAGAEPLLLPLPLLLCQVVISETPQEVSGSGLQNKTSGVLFQPPTCVTVRQQPRRFTAQQRPHLAVWPNTCLHI